MALTLFTILSKNSISYIAFRQLRTFTGVQKFIQYSTSTVSTSDKSSPVKYTTNRAAKLTIGETLGIPDEKSKMNWYEKFIIIGSFAAFIIYFCVLREENDIDEIMKGNPDYNNSIAVQLVNLKLKLKYCEMNQLPTSKLKAKIEELELQRVQTPVFVK